MNNLTHYYYSDILIHIDPDLDLEYDVIDTDLMYDIAQDIVSALKKESDKNSKIEFVEIEGNLDLSDNYSARIWMNSSLEYSAAKQLFRQIVDSIQFITCTDEFFDGTYFTEPHGERVGNTFDITYKVYTDFDITEFVETDKDNNPVTNELTEENELEKRAKKHRKKQAGITTLNPDAGNVEYNIAMFNNANSPVEGPSNNPISGPVGGDVATSSPSSGVCEDLDTDGWEKRWSWADKYYKQNLVVSKLPNNLWHLEKVSYNGHTLKHLGNYSTKEAAFSKGNNLLNEALDDLYVDKSTCDESSSMCSEGCNKRSNEALDDFDEDDVCKSDAECCFDSDECKIQQCENDIDDLFQKAHTKYIYGRINTETYSKTLAKIHHMLAELDYDDLVNDALTEDLNIDDIKDELQQKLRQRGLQLNPEKNNLDAAAEYILMGGSDYSVDQWIEDTKRNYPDHFIR